MRGIQYVFYPPETGEAVRIHYDCAMRETAECLHRIISVERMLFYTTILNTVLRLEQESTSHESQNNNVLLMFQRPLSGPVFHSRKGNAYFLKATPSGRVSHIAYNVVLFDKHLSR